jgi:hypothetical protein
VEVALTLVGMGSTPSLIWPLVFTRHLKQSLAWDAVDLAVGDASLPCPDRDGVLAWDEVEVVLTIVLTKLERVLTIIKKEPLRRAAPVQN